MIRSLTRRQAREGLRVTALHALRLLTLVLCGNPALFAGIRPVSPAVTAAALGSGWPLWTVLAGSALACLSGGWSLSGACALLGNGLIAALLRLPRARGRLQAEGRREGAVCLAAFAGGCAQFFARTGPLSARDAIACLSGALIAAMLAPCLIGAMRLEAGRTLLRPDEQLSVRLLGALAVCGLSALNGAGEWVGGAAAALYVLLGASCGAADGALTGVCAGMALAAREANLSYAAALALCGALAGALRGVNRAAMSAALLGGSLLGVVYGGMERWSLALPAALAGCLAFSCLPAPALERIRGLMRARPLAPDIQALSVRLRREAAQQTGRLARAFQALEESYAPPEAPFPNEVALIRRMREALCAGCEDYARCWQGERAQAGRLLCRMMSEAVAGKPPSAAAQLPPDDTRHCRRSTQIDRRLQPVLSRFAGERAQALHTSGLQDVLRRQSGQAARILARLSAQLARPVCVDEDCARLAQAALEACGLPCREVLALDADRFEILAVPARPFTGAEALRAAQALGEELGLPFAPAPCEDDPACLRLVQGPRCAFVSASLQAPAEGEAACGDCCRDGSLPDGRYLLALCDGMGNGGAARAMSARALELMERLLVAGVALDAALDSVNCAMLSHGGERFTTLDLCVLDPVRGTADFCKLGAAPSILLHGDACERIPGGRLPMGVLDEVSPVRRRCALREGDWVVMFSDGVADELKEGQLAWLEALLPRVRALQPAQAAALLIDEAKARDGGRAPDDMTALLVFVQALPVPQKSDKKTKKSTSHPSDAML